MILTLASDAVEAEAVAQKGRRRGVVTPLTKRTVGQARCLAGSPLRMSRVRLKIAVHGRVRDRLPRPGSLVRMDWPMRITFSGPYRLKGFGDAMLRVVENLAANGVEDVSRVNIYLNIGADDRPVVLTGPMGVPIDHIAFDEPTERRFTAASPDVRIGYAVRAGGQARYPLASGHEPGSE